jgi:hypothetical protein
MGDAASTDDAFADYLENVAGNESDSEAEEEVGLRPVVALDSCELCGKCHSVTQR